MKCMSECEMESLCDNFCKWPSACEEQEELDAHCGHCPLDSFKYHIQLKVRKEKEMTDKELMAHANEETALAFGETDKEFIRLNGYLAHVYNERFITRILTQLLDEEFSGDYIKSEVEEYFARNADAVKKYLAECEEETAHE